MAVLLALLAFADTAFAWGDQGHRVICEIAMRRVAPETRAEIGRLLLGNSEAGEFIETCTWADHPRKRAPEHFLNLPRDAQGPTGDGCGEAPTCVLSAIQQDGRILASRSSTDSEKLAALKYLAHWVGDIHQPLHVSFKDDRGGNDVRVSGACSSNLHSAWDTCLVVEAVGNDAAAAASMLLTSLRPGQVEAWVRSTPRDWANESFAIAKSEAMGYCQKANGSCMPATRTVKIDAAYLEANRPVVRAQLLKAGVRLGQLLDSAVGHSRR